MKPTLGQVFTLSLLGLGAALGLLFYVVFAVSRATIIESSERIRDGASREIGERVTAFLGQAPAMVQVFQHALNRGLVDLSNPQEVERALLSPLLASSDIGEVTFTYGEKTGTAKDGSIQLAPEPRGQMSVWRVPGVPGDDRLLSQRVRQAGGKFLAARHESAPLGVAAAPVQAGETEVPDPTAHATFLTPASAEYYGQALWSDLHWSQLDSDLPESQRRVEVSVQQVITDAQGKFAGVLRVGLLAQQLGQLVQLNLSSSGARDPHQLFLCDAEGHLITRGVAEDRLQETDDELRVLPAAVPEPIASALREPTLRSVSQAEPLASGRFRRGGEDYLTTFRALPGTQEWVIGIVVPRAFYLGKLTAMRDRLLVLSSAIMLVLVAGGSLIVRSVQRAQTQIVRESLKMNKFEFTSSPTEAPFRDVSEVLESLEMAKTAMRAMGKYAPIDLVRRLYREKSEPVLGGQDIDVSIMFTDIKGFTTLSEELPPNLLAAALGRYLDVMTRIIQQETRGTIDKYIGDAIMTLWNAPEPVADHARLACLAALRCREAGRELSRSPEWGELPPFETRFGLHRDTTLVGHFGAPDRMNYTAIGDAVNLASRLEGLNKQYGTAIIASERIVETAGAEFDFRLLDCVAVKGKHKGVKIYELLGHKDGPGGRPPHVGAYEKAFAAYLARDFAAALEILEKNADDPPSVGLAERCRALLEEPPPPGWNGVHVATAK